MSDIFEKKKQQLRALKNSGDVNHILNEAYKILGNPIVLFDTSYNMLDCVEGIVTDDWLWNEITTLGTFHHETIDFFITENFIETFDQSDIVSLMKSEKLKYERMNGKLFDKDDVQLGDICVVACMKPFEKDCAKLIEILCEILSFELQSSKLYQRIDRVYQKSLVNILIDEDIKNNKIVKVKIAELSETLKTNLYLAVIDISQYEYTITHLAYFRDLFKKMQAEYNYFIHLNYIVMIISIDDALLNIKRDLKKLNELFIKYKIYAGISSRFQDLLELQKHYREAINALNYGLRGKRTRQIYRYDNIRVEHFFNAVKSNADISELYSPVIFLIQEYDRAYNASLLELLYTYLLYGKEAKLTCDKLEISQTELNEQLRKLVNDFGIEWENGDMLCNIFISIKMIDNFL